MLGAQTERTNSTQQGLGAEIRAHYSHLQTLTSSHCPLLPDPPNCHIPLHSDYPSFLMQNLKMERKNEELHAEKEAGKVSHLNITEFGASIWLSQHGSGLQRSDLETINHKKPLNGTRSECWSPGLLSTQLSKCFSNREPRHCIQIVLKAVLPSFTSSTYNPFSFGHASCIIKLFLSHFDASRNLL